MYQVIVFDEEHEKDLEEEINSFIRNRHIKIMDIRFSSSCCVSDGNQIFCFSALILYQEDA